MKINESIENYLETILMLEERISTVRAIDIVNELGYSKASISVAMKKMKEDGLVAIGVDNYIELTKKGSNIAKKIYERHRILSEFFISLGVKKEMAIRDACKIEHDISDETFEKIKKTVISKKN